MYLSEMLVQLCALEGFYDQLFCVHVGEAHLLPG